MRLRLTVVEPIAAVMGGGLAGLPAPVWTPWPLPSGWRFAGLAHTSRSHGGSTVGTVSAWHGMDPFGDPAELLLVCEEAGSDLGSRFAGSGTSYPSQGVGEGPPHARFSLEGRPVSLWTADGSSDRAVYAGEAAGRWLWVIVHPAEASAIVVQPLQFVDARKLGAEWSVLPIGELSPRLVID